MLGSTDVMSGSKTYRASTTRDDAVERESIGDSMRHARAPRSNGLVDGLLLLVSIERIAGGGRAVGGPPVSEGVDHCDGYEKQLRKGLVGNDLVALRSTSRCNGTKRGGVLGRRRGGWGWRSSRGMGRADPRLNEAKME